MEYFHIYFKNNFYLNSENILFISSGGTSYLISFIALNKLNYSISIALVGMIGLFNVCILFFSDLFFFSAAIFSIILEGLF